MLVVVIRLWPLPAAGSADLYIRVIFQGKDAGTCASATNGAFRIQ